MGEFTTTLAGASHRQEQVLDAIEVMASGPTNIFFIAEPDNPHDPNAVRVEIEKMKFFGKKRVHIGYLPAGVAANVVGKAEQLQVKGAQMRAPTAEFDFWNIMFTLDDGE